MTLLTTEQVRAELTRGGFIAATEEADELVEAADGDPATLADFLRRRMTGEPLAWITRSSSFLGRTIAITPGVYVPRWQSEALARHAIELLPPLGRAIDLCTGSGALAVTLRDAHPAARVIGTDLNPVAVECARRNGVEAYCGDLFDPVPQACRTEVDLITSIAPYVPTALLDQLPRDTMTFESPLAYDGGDDGLSLITKVATGATGSLVSGGSLLSEVGPDQIEPASGMLTDMGFVITRVLVDGDGDARGIASRYG